ncbi:DUF5131 family protein [Haloarcula pellucida]|uniref:Protein gp37 n=1 Tax=Haloarcula pellucida TaxID=1427151 RepID=A0A830GR27_9EURY|nr:DUF5131 family protein [Halomicroarcula pellucida]MBX0350510.1 phage Gp37/Gp68 family protein [Halomicroarcula pellucida]GGO03656.1 hypothetical protein GCM10009030_39560 [Halomicroarcula pellucida]
MPSEDSGIGWTDSTWNPVHGCFKTSEGCANCYAAVQSQRWDHTEHAWTVDNAEENVQLQRDHLGWPRNRDPKRIFVNSMSDLFLPEDLVPDDYLHDVFDVIEACDQHVFQALTKHGAEHDNRMLVWDREATRWPDNLWMGVTVESAERTYRIDHLRNTAASTKWISFEPLLGPVDVDADDLEGIDWVVIGGESGPEADRREMDHAWAREIRDAAKAQGIPVFFKQSSARYPERGRRLAEAGEGLNEAALLGADQTEYRELPELTPALRDARPDLRDQEVIVDA